MKKPLVDLTFSHLASQLPLGRANLIDITKRMSTQLDAVAAELESRDEPRVTVGDMVTCVSELFSVIAALTPNKIDDAGAAVLHGLIKVLNNEHHPA